MRANESGPVAGAAPEPAEAMTIVTAESLAWYESGVLHGIEIGRQQVEEEWRGRMTVSAAIARQIAAWGPFDELAERRGDHDRAQAQRAILAERGIA